jgi:hypothetical protein
MYGENEKFTENIGQVTSRGRPKCRWEDNN